MEAILGDLVFNSPPSLFLWLPWKAGRREKKALRQEKRQWHLPSQQGQTHHSPEALQKSWGSNMTRNSPQPQSRGFPGDPHPGTEQHELSRVLPISPRDQLPAWLFLRFPQEGCSEHHTNKGVGTEALGPLAPVLGKAGKPSDRTSRFLWLWLPRYLKGDELR